MDTIVRSTFTITRNKMLIHGQNSLKDSLRIDHCMPPTSVGCGEGAEGPPRAHKSPPAAGFCDDGEDAGAGNALPTPKAAAHRAAA